MDDVHGQLVVPAGQFKQTCLALLDRVAEERITVVVTKRGRRVARVVPPEEPAEIFGSVRILTAHEDELFSTGEDWKADRRE